MRLRFRGYRKIYMKGIFITIEGVEGSGKSTQAKLLSDYLKSKGHRVVLTKEPGATKISTEIRKVLLNPRNSRISYLAELFLYLADRSQHVEEVIIPALKKCKIVICDRFSDSTLSYQGYGRGISINLINKLNKIATKGIGPDLTFILDTEVKAGLKRAKQEKGENDRIEKEKIEFHKKVRYCYQEIARKEKNRARLIKIKKDPLDTQLILRKITDDLLKEKF